VDGNPVREQSGGRRESENGRRVFSSDKGAQKNTTPEPSPLKEEDEKVLESTQEYKRCEKAKDERIRGEVRGTPHRPSQAGPPSWDVYTCIFAWVELEKGSANRLSQHPSDFGRGEVGVAKTQGFESRRPS